MNTDECQSKPRRIAFFSDSAYPTINGVSVSVASLTEEFHRRGILVDLYSPTDFPCLRIKGVSIPLALPWSRKALSRFKENLPDVVHIHTPFGAGIAGLAWAKKHGIPVVYSHHTHYPHFVDYVTPGFRALASFVCRTWLNVFLKSSKAVITPTAVSEKWLQEFGYRDRINVVPTGTNLITPENPTTRKDRKIILCVGRLAREKNLDLIIQAFSQLDQTKHELFIVGEGPLKTVLESKSAGLSVRFLGELPPKKVHELYFLADVLAITADRETQGLVVNEALSAGLPVAALYGGGAASQVQPGKNGSISDQLGFAENLRKCLLIPRQQFKNVQIKETCEDTLNIYEEVLQRQIEREPSQELAPIRATST